MKYIESPTVLGDFKNSIFMAGGISNCPDWQSELVKKLEDTDLTLINPRRKDFPMGNLVEGKKQIRWESDHLRGAEYISFWFPCETLNPITLFELGSWSMTNKPIFVGCHPDYKRKFDLEVQLPIRRPYLRIVHTIDGLAKQIRATCLNHCIECDAEISRNSYMCDPCYWDLREG